MIKHKHSKTLYCESCGALNIVHKGRRRYKNNICDKCLPVSNNSYIPVATITASPRIENSDADCVDSLLAIVDKDFKDDFSYGTPEAYLAKKDLKNTINTMLKDLTENQFRVMNLLYSSDYELEEVGDIMQISKKEVNILITQAFRKLRHSSRSQPLREFINI